MNARTAMALLTVSMIVCTTSTVHVASTATRTRTRTQPRPLVAFTELPFSWFRQLDFRPLPYTGGTSAALNKTWVFGVSCCNSTGSESSAFFTEGNLKRASAHYAPFLTPRLECTGCSGNADPGIERSMNLSSCIGEWGYEFQAFSASNPAFAQQPCVNLTMATKAALNLAPRDRLEALDWMNAYYDCRKRKSRTFGAGGIMDLIGHYFYSGLGAERGGTTVVAAEIQENINSIQFHLALTRGVARQFALPWAIDVSPWDAGFITDYSTARPWGAASASGGNGGHSISLFKRSWWLSYLSGANHLIAEAGGLNLFYQNLSTDGVYALSPLGEEARRLANFTAKDHARARPYAPVAVVLPHAHGYGLSLVSGPEPLAWNHFPLTGQDRVAWQLIQAVFPGSWTVKTRGQQAESNYLVPSPYGDVFDVLNERGSIAALALYRVAFMAGNVSLGSMDVLTQLGAWVRQGGTAVVFASQLGAASGGGGGGSAAAAAAAAALIGAELGGQVNVSCSSFHTVTDVETGWTHSRSSMAITKDNTHSAGSGNTAPFCVPEATAGLPPYYIKTGGDPSFKVGWKKQSLWDRCCEVSQGQCRWFASLALCTAALASHVSCLSCTSCTEISNGCPSWQSGCPQPYPPPPPPSRGLTGVRKPGTATTVLQATAAAAGKDTAPSFPVVLRNSVGNGTFVTVLLEDDVALGGLGILPHLLSRVAEDVLPFEVVAVGTGANMLATQVEMLLARRPSGWQVTLVNNFGVVKQPDTAAVVDPSKRLSATVRMKPGYGNVASAALVTATSTTLLAVNNNSATVVVEAGDLAVINIELVLE